MQADVGRCCRFKVMLQGAGAFLLLLFLVTSASCVSAQGTRPSASASGGDSVSGLEKCIGPTFDDQGVISIASRCTVPVEITWFYGVGNQGTASLSPHDSVSTDVSASQIPRLGVLRFFACPSTHPIFRDSKGEYLNAPSTEYHCDLDNAKIATSNAPRTFTYDLLTSGDCVLERGALTFDAKGNGQWRAKIHTNHTTNRDIWHVSFTALDSNGRPLFPVSLGDSPAMFGSPSPTIPWAVMFTFDAAKFRLLDHVTVQTSC